MSSHPHLHEDNLSFVIVILVGAAAWQHRTLLVRITYITLGLTTCAVILTWLIRLARHSSEVISNVNAMTGLEFEHHIAGLLRKNGFHKIRLTERYDYGVDIIAEKDGVRWGIQTKRYSGLVKANAVRQVVTALNIYKCDRAMVITNSSFSSIARRLAQANDCVLIDHNGLQRLARQRCIL